MKLGMTSRVILVAFLSYLKLCVWPISCNVFLPSYWATIGQVEIVCSHVFFEIQCFIMSVLNHS